jgi:hypothetical protein
MKLEGEIAEIDLIERLVELWREQFTGAIRFENDGIIKIIYFKGGDVLSASTNDRADSVDEILMRAGKVTREHVKQALSKRKENETLGDALLNLGFITRKELTWARRVQAIGVIRSIIGWGAGSYTIVADYLPKREEGTLFALPQILVELIVTEQDRARFERLLDGGAIVYTKTAEFDDTFRRLGLNEDADAIAEAIDGGNTAADVAAASGRESFNVYKLLHALATLGLLRKVEAPLPRTVEAQVTPELSLDYSFADAGVADAADALDLTPMQSPMQSAEGDWDALPPEKPSAVPTDWSVDGQNFEVADITPPAAQPVLEPSYSFDEPADEAPTGQFAPSIEPEPEPEPLYVPPPVTEKMPAWDAPRPQFAAPIPPKSETPPAKTEEWGFDEAQIEAARKAAAPAPLEIGGDTTRTRRKAGGPPPKGDSRFGLIIALIVIGVVAGLGYGGWMWWQARQESLPTLAAAANTTTALPRVRPRAVPAETGTLIATATDSTGTQATATVPPLTETLSTAPPNTTTAVSVAPPPVASRPTTTTRPPSADSGVTLGRTSTGSAVMTNSGSAPASSASRGRYDDMAREYAANATGNYTVQFAIICEASNIEKSVRSGGDSVWFVPISYRGKPCYRVFWGRYDTREAAAAATSQLPASLRGASPVVVKVPRG